MRKYRKVDTSSMTPVELKKYKKTLAAVRQYTRDRREWQKQLKDGQSSYKTLQTFRDAKYGRMKSVVQEKVVERAMATKLPTKNGASGDLIGKIERLLTSLKNAESQKQLVIQELHELAG